MGVQGNCSEAPPDDYVKCLRPRQCVITRRIPEEQQESLADQEELGFDEMVFLSVFHEVHVHNVYARTQISEATEFPTEFPTFETDAFALAPEGSVLYLTGVATDGWITGVNLSKRPPGEASSSMRTNSTNHDSSRERSLYAEGAASFMLDHSVCGAPILHVAEKKRDATVRALARMRPDSLQRAHIDRFCLQIPYSSTDGCLLPTGASATA